MSPKWWLLLTAAAYLGFKIKGHKEFTSSLSAIDHGIAVGSVIYLITKLKEVEAI